MAGAMKEGEDGVPQRGENLRCCAGPNAAPILAEDDIAQPMTTLHTPMTANELQEGGRVMLVMAGIGHVVPGLLPDSRLTGDSPLDLHRLLDARKGEVARQVTRDTEASFFDASTLSIPGHGLLPDTGGIGEVVDQIGMQERLVRFDRQQIVPTVVQDGLMDHMHTAV